MVGELPRLQGLLRDINGAQRPLEVEVGGRGVGVEVPAAVE